MKDPFEAATEESPPESPVETEQTPEEDERVMGVRRQLKKRKTSVVAEPTTTTADPVKMAKMKAILSQFTENQMSRYESFRRSAFQKGNMKKMLQNITGNQKIDPLINIVVCGITKMFVGELVETARLVMGERKESGPIRPCHMRESFRRLKLQGKVPKRSVPRLFRLSKCSKGQSHYICNQVFVSFSTSLSPVPNFIKMM